MKLKTSLLIMAVVPIFILGVAITSFSLSSFTDAMYEEVEVELTNVASAISHTLDMAYPGDYVVYGDAVRTLVKGEKILNDNFQLIDPIKEKTGLDISIFYGNLRYLTTMEDRSGNRLIGTYCTAIVSKEVLDTGKGKFYNNIEVDTVKYFAYYMPVFNADGKCVGMVAILKHASDVNAMVLNAALPTFLIAFVAMVITGTISVKFAQNLTRDLNRLKKFMKDVGDGKLKPDSGFELIERQDEISDMYKSALMMQKSLRELVELDALTMIENRRSANKLLTEMQKEFEEINEKYVIVLGDIDHFKKVNDTYGHEAGDRVLKGVADILKKYMKGKGFAARWGGEEFLLGFKGYEIAAAVEETKAILSLVRQMSVETEDQNVQVTMSFGVAEADKELNVDKLIKVADERLYAAKEKGRNRVVYSVDGEEDTKSDNQKMELSQPIEVDSDIMDYIKELNGEDDGRTDI